MCQSWGSWERGFALESAAARVCRVGSLGVLETVEGEGAKRDSIDAALWKLRWLAIMSCAGARAVASSLLELRGHGGADGVVPFLMRLGLISDRRISSRFVLHGGSVISFVWWDS